MTESRTRKRNMLEAKRSERRKLKRRMEKSKGMGSTMRDWIMLQWIMSKESAREKGRRKRRNGPGKTDPHEKKKWRGQAHPKWSEKEWTKRGITRRNPEEKTMKEFWL
jgi:hypothetical protein